MTVSFIIRDDNSFDTSTHNHICCTMEQTYSLGNTQNCPLNYKKCSHSLRFLLKNSACLMEKKVLHQYLLFFYGL